ILACIPIGVHDNSTFLASEEGIVTTRMSILRNSTAVRTELGCMPRVNDVKCNSVVETAGSKNLLELEKRDSHDGPIKSSSFGFEPFQLLDGNVSTIFSGNEHYFSDHLPEIGINVIHFSTSQSSKCLKVIIGLHDASTPRYVLAFNPDVLPEISLIQHFPFVRNYGNCNVFCIDVNPKDILPRFENNIILAKVCNNF